MEGCSFKEGCIAPLVFPRPRIGKSGWRLLASSDFFLSPWATKVAMAAALAAGRERDGNKCRYAALEIPSKAGQKADGQGLSKLSPGGTIEQSRGLPQCVSRKLGEHSRCNTEDWCAGKWKYRQGRKPGFSWSILISKRLHQGPNAESKGVNNWQARKGLRAAQKSWVVKFPLQMKFDNNCRDAVEVTIWSGERGSSWTIRGAWLMHSRRQCSVAQQDWLIVKVEGG